MVNMIVSTKLSETIRRVADAMLDDHATLESVAHSVGGMLTQSVFGDYEVSPLPGGCDEIILRPDRFNKQARSPKPENIEITLASNANLHFADFCETFGCGKIGQPLLDTEDAYFAIFYFPCYQEQYDTPMTEEAGRR